MIIEHRHQPIDRRQLLRWIAHTSAGVAGLGLLGCSDRPELAADAMPGTDGDGGTCVPTSSDVLGPYYRAGAPSRMVIASPTEPGDRLVLEGVVVGGTSCMPLAGALIDVWQADKDGRYYEPNGAEPYRLRGKLAAGSDGSWQVQTIRPGNYMLGAASWRPAHVHVTVSHPGFRTLTTQLYFEGDPYLPPNDGCKSCGSDDPARILPLVPTASGLRGELRIVLA
ncbi:MAG: twin-arginine translocation pathway signal protein [Deltaproteobacteria bacterium]|nr:twin-arginine translocation pathway signal protein [Deltaproteobacteria bacterium]